MGWGWWNSQDEVALPSALADPKTAGNVTVGKISEKALRSSWSARTRTFASTMPFKRFYIDVVAADSEDRSEVERGLMQLPDLQGVQTGHSWNLSTSFTLFSIEEEAFLLFVALASSNFCHEFHNGWDSFAAKEVFTKLDCTPLAAAFTAIQKPSLRHYFILTPWKHLLQLVSRSRTCLTQIRSGSGQRANRQVVRYVAAV